MIARFRPSAVVRLVARAVTAVSFVPFASLAACGGAPNAPASSAEIAPTCAMRLPPRTSALAGATTLPSFTSPRSTLIVHAEIPLESVRKALEARVPKRVVEERDADIGVAGRLEWSVDRGAFTVHVQNDRMVVEAPLEGRARACAKGSCYASCEPAAKATAVVPLHLSADYSLRTSDLRVEVTRGCELRVAGGFLRVDVTPMLRAGLSREVGRIQASIDRELPDLEPDAARLWAELSKPRSLPLGACVIVAPEEIVQGPPSGDSDVARLRFGLAARPELRVRCGEAPKIRPLPALRTDPTLPEKADVGLALVLPPESATSALESGEVLDLSRGRARVQKASGDAASGIELELLGEACGPLAVTASGAAWKDDRSLRLAGITLAAGERERMTSVGLDPANVARSLEQAAIALPLTPDALATSLPELVRGSSTPSFSVDAKIDEAKPAVAALRGRDIVGLVRLRGAVTVRAR